MPTPQGNRGMLLEQEVELTNKQYAIKGIAQVQKVATPIKVIKKMPGGKLMACWDRKSTVDFIGCLADGRYICFDAKETQEKSLKLANIKPHQIKHLKATHDMGGAAFILVWFRKVGKCYALPYEALETYMNTSEAKSIPIKYFEENGEEIYFGDNGFSINYLCVKGEIENE